MATLYTAGPTHVYVGLQNCSPGQALYLGTCEEAPVIEVTPEYRPVRNDIGGETPFDLSFQGESAVTQGDFNRLNRSAYNGLAARPRSLQAGSTPGLNAPGDVGSLVLTEGDGISLFLLFAFGANGASPKPAYIANGLPPGYRFPVSVLFGPDRITTGTRPQKYSLLFRSIRLWSPLTQSFLLYDFGVAGLPGIN